MHRPNHSHRTSVAALVLACSLWGTTFLFGKLALAELAVSHVVLFRFGVGSLVLLPIAWLRRDWPHSRDLPLFLLTGFLTVPVTFLLQFGGLALTSVARASLILGALPPLLALTAALFQGEKLGRQGWAAVTASTAGVLLIVGKPGAGVSWLGDGLVFLSLVSTVVWVLLGKGLSQKYSGLTATTFILVSGTLTLLPFSLWRDGLPSLDIGVTVWTSVLAMGVLCTAMTFALWNWALERVPASQAGVFVNLEPVIGAVLGVAIFHETLGLATLLGGLLVLSSAWVISRMAVQAGRGDSQTPSAETPLPAPATDFSAMAS